MPKHPLIIGLSGGIGSGKTEVSQRFSALGITIVDADVVARDVVQPNTPALQKIAARFGNTILNTDGTLNRSLLRGIIFSKPDEKSWLEELLHPVINAEIRRQLANAKGSYVIFVSPLLLETRQRELVDRILIVDTSVSSQLVRAVTRDKSKPENIQAIINTQISREERLSLADDIIVNNSSLDELNQQVSHLHQQYLKLAGISG